MTSRRPKLKPKPNLGSRPGGSARGGVAKPVCQPSIEVETQESAPIENNNVGDQSSASKAPPVESSIGEPKPKINDISTLNKDGNEDVEDNVQLNSSECAIPAKEDMLSSNMNVVKLTTPAKPVDGSGDSITAEEGADLETASQASDVASDVKSGESGKPSVGRRRIKKPLVNIGAVARRPKKQVTKESTDKEKKVEKLEEAVVVIQEKVSDTNEVITLRSPRPMPYKESGTHCEAVENDKQDDQEAPKTPKRSFTKIIPKLSLARNRHPSTSQSEGVLSPPRQHRSDSDAVNDASQNEAVVESPIGGINEKKVTNDKKAAVVKTKKTIRRTKIMEGPIDRTKWTMRDIIYMNPIANPMKSTQDEELKERAVDRPGESRSPQAGSVVGSPKHGSVPPGEAAGPGVGEVSDPADHVADPDEDEDSMPVPQVTMDADGNIIIRESSLVLTAPKPKVIDDEFLLSKHRAAEDKVGYGKRTYAKQWPRKETKKFYMALSSIGTDFSLMVSLFPNRTRTELKRKFKREDKINRALVDHALKDRRDFDMTLFDNLSSTDSEQENDDKNSNQGDVKGEGGKKKKKKQKTVKDVLENASKEAEEKCAEKKRAPKRKKSTEENEDVEQNENDLPPSKKTNKNKQLMEYDDDRIGPIIKITKRKRATVISSDEEEDSVPVKSTTTTTVPRMPTPEPICIRSPPPTLFSSLEGAQAPRGTMMSPPPPGITPPTAGKFIPLSNLNQSAMGNINVKEMQAGQLVFVTSTPPTDQATTPDGKPQKVIHVYMVSPASSSAQESPASPVSQSPASTRLNLGGVSKIAGISQLPPSARKTLSGTKSPPTLVRTSGDEGTLVQHDAEDETPKVVQTSSGQTATLVTSKLMPAEASLKELELEPSLKQGCDRVAVGSSLNAEAESGSKAGSNEVVVDDDVIIEDRPDDDSNLEVISVHSGSTDKTAREDVEKDGKVDDEDGFGYKETYKETCGRNLQTIKDTDVNSNNGSNHGVENMHISSNVSEAGSVTGKDNTAPEEFSAKSVHDDMEKGDNNAEKINVKPLKNKEPTEVAIDQPSETNKVDSQEPSKDSTPNEKAQSSSFTRRRKIKAAPVLKARPRNSTDKAVEKSKLSTETSKKDLAVAKDGIPNEKAVPKKGFEKQPVDKVVKGGDSDNGRLPVEGSVKETQKCTKPSVEKASDFAQMDDKEEKATRENNVIQPKESGNEIKDAKKDGSTSEKAQTSTLTRRPRFKPAPVIRPAKRPQKVQAPREENSPTGKEEVKKGSAVRSDEVSVSESIEDKEKEMNNPLSSSVDEHEDEMAASNKVSDAAEPPSDTPNLQHKMVSPSKKGTKSATVDEFVSKIDEHVKMLAKSRQEKLYDCETSVPVKKKAKNTLSKTSSLSSTIRDISGSGSASLSKPNCDKSNEKTIATGSSVMTFTPVSEKRTFEKDKKTDNQDDVSFFNQSKLEKQSKPSLSERDEIVGQSSPVGRTSDKTEVVRPILKPKQTSLTTNRSQDKQSVTKEIEVVVNPSVQPNTPAKLSTEMLSPQSLQRITKETEIIVSNPVSPVNLDSSGCQLIESVVDLANLPEGADVIEFEVKLRGDVARTDNEQPDVLIDETSTSPSKTSSTVSNLVEKGSEENNPLLEKSNLVNKVQGSVESSNLRGGSQEADSKTPQVYSKVEDETIGTLDKEKVDSQTLLEEIHSKIQTQILHAPLKASDSNEQILTQRHSSNALSAPSGSKKQTIMERPSSRQHSRLEDDQPNVTQSPAVAGGQQKQIIIERPNSRQGKMLCGGAKQIIIERPNSRQGKKLCGGAKRPRSRARKEQDAVCDDLNDSFTSSVSGKQVLTERPSSRHGSRPSSRASNASEISSLDESFDSTKHIKQRLVERPSSRQASKMHIEPIVIDEDTAPIMGRAVSKQGNQVLIERPSSRQSSRPPSACSIDSPIKQETPGPSRQPECRTPTPSYRPQSRPGSRQEIRLVSKRKFEGGLDSDDSSFSPPRSSKSHHVKDESSPIRTLMSPPPPRDGSSAQGYVIKRFKNKEGQETYVVEKN